MGRIEAIIKGDNLIAQLVVLVVSLLLDAGFSIGGEDTEWIAVNSGLMQKNILDDEKLELACDISRLQTSGMSLKLRRRRVEDPDDLDLAFYDLHFSVPELNRNLLNVKLEGGQQQQKIQLNTSEIKDQKQIELLPDVSLRIARDLILPVLAESARRSSVFLEALPRPSNLEATGFSKARRPESQVPGEPKRKLSPNFKPGEGMLVGPEHPDFFGGFLREDPPQSSRISVPRGARFDPVAPDNPLGYLPRREDWPPQYPEVPIPPNLPGPHIGPEGDFPDDLTGNLPRTAMRPPRQGALQQMPFSDTNHGRGGIS